MKRLLFLVLLFLCSCAALQRPQQTTEQKSAVHTSLAVRNIPPLSEELKTGCKETFEALSSLPGVLARGDPMHAFYDPMEQVMRFGCGIRIAGSMKLVPSDTPLGNIIRDYFSKAGWTEVNDYGADGEDGMRLAFRKEAIVCILEGDWTAAAAPETKEAEASPLLYMIRGGCAQVPSSRARISNSPKGP